MLQLIPNRAEKLLEFWCLTIFLFAAIFYMVSLENAEFGRCHDIEMRSATMFWEHSFGDKKIPHSTIGASISSSSFPFQKDLIVFV